MVAIWNSKWRCKEIAEDAEVQYIENKCIKQEYQRLFQKSNPVFPVLKS